MAGHSHWANIAHKKGRNDKKRGVMFHKLSMAIIVAARNGGGDPDTNLRLRYAIDKAKKLSMPKDNIERAVKKGTGEGDDAVYNEITYEGFGPGSTAVIVEALTENPNRTASEVRNIFKVHGGELGKSNSAAFLFDRKGLIQVPKSGETESEDAEAKDAPPRPVNEERLFEAAVEAGAEDVRDAGESFEVLTPPAAFDAVVSALDEAGIVTGSSDVTLVPQTTVSPEAGDAKRLLQMLEAFEDNQDVQNVIANFDIPDDVMAEVMADAR